MIFRSFQLALAIIPQGFWDFLIKCCFIWIFVSDFRVAIHTTWNQTANKITNVGHTEMIRAIRDWIWQNYQANRVKRLKSFFYLPSSLFFTPCLLPSLTLEAYVDQKVFSIPAKLQSSFYKAKWEKKKFNALNSKRISLIKFR